MILRKIIWKSSWNIEFVFGEKDEYPWSPQCIFPAHCAVCACPCDLRTVGMTLPSACEAAPGSKRFEVNGVQVLMMVSLISALDLSCSQEQVYKRKSWVTSSSLFSLFQFTQNAAWENQGHHFCESLSNPVVFSPVWWEIMLHSVWEVKLLIISTSSLSILHFSSTSLNSNFWKKLIPDYCATKDCTAQQYKNISCKAAVWSNLSQNNFSKIKARLHFCILKNF